MSESAFITGAGDDDPTTIGQFSYQRNYTTATSGVSSVTSNSSAIVVSPNTGAVTLTYNGPKEIVPGPGIDVTTNMSGDPVVSNIGVRSLQAGTGITLSATSGDNVLISATGGGGGGGGTVSAFSVGLPGSTFVYDTDGGTIVPLAPWEDPDARPHTFNVGGDFNPTTGMYTAPIDGNYLFNFQIGFATGGGGTAFSLVVNYGGTETSAAQSWTTTDPTVPMCQQTIRGKLHAGDTVCLIGDGTFPMTLNSISEGNGLLTWFSGGLDASSSGGGGGGGGGASAPESFCICLAADQTFPDSGGAPTNSMGPWTDSVGTDFAAQSPSILFNNLTAGSLDLSTGAFTCGVSGPYFVSWTCVNLSQATNGSTLILMDTTANLPLSFGAGPSGNTGGSYISFRPLYDLIEGHVYRLFNANGSGTSSTITYIDGGFDSSVPSTMLYVSLFTGASGGGGGSGVQSITAGTGIGVNTLDPTAPVVTNTGVTSLTAGAGMSLSGATGAVTATNTGVLSLASGTNTSVVNLGGGVWRVNASGSGGGGGTFTSLNTGPPSGLPTTNGLTLALAYPNYTIYNNAVLQLTAGAGISITGDQRNKTILATGSYRRIGFFQNLSANQSRGSGTLAVAPITGWNRQTSNVNNLYWNTLEFASGLPNGQVVIPVTGIWHITAQIISNNDRGRVVICQGAGVPGGTPILAGNISVSSTVWLSQINAELYFPANTLVSICFSESGSATLFTNYGSVSLPACWWGMRWVGPTSYN